MYKYKNPAISVQERVNDLISRMSFEQKIDQITCLVTITEDIPDFKKYIPNGIGNVGAFTVAKNAELIADYSLRLQKFLVEETELGIPALIHCEASAGAQFTEANVFPSAIAQSSSFNTANVLKMADLIREQLYAVGFRQALSPVFDIARDPRWGRITETYGEDPTLTSAMGSAFVKGLQGTDKTRGIAATAKHFVGHGITEGGLNMGRSLISERELEEVHCKPFQAAITDSGLMSVMNSYCSLNGEPVVCSRKILTELLRDHLGFVGFVVSDYISVDRIVDPFCVAENFEQAGIKALNAGLDVEYPRPKGYTYKLREAVENGQIAIETIDSAVRRVLKAKFELGLFENPYPDKNMLKKVLHNKRADELNLQMAKESLILLKNNNHTLPLPKDIKRIAVVGPHADSIRSYFGTFSYPAVLDMTASRDEDGQVFEEPGLIIYDVMQLHPGDIRESTRRTEKKLRSEFTNSKTLIEAIREYLPHAEINYAQGINYAGSNISGMKYALQVAADADVVIMTIGGKNGWGVTSTVGEGIDSTSIDLPGRQEEFARAIRALNKKTVVVHFDGRPLSNEYVATHFDAILEAWQPGEFGGQAITSVLFGDYNPAGRLPVTAARNVGQIPVYYGLPRGSGYISAGHTGMIRNPNGYINDTAFPLYCFGHGLSYTQFTYHNFSISSKKVKACDVAEIKVDITNVGKLDGDEVVQLYGSDLFASMVRPSKELLGFLRISLAAGETKTVMFTFKISQLAFIDADMKWRVEAGEIKLMVGASSNDIRCEETIEVEDTAFVDPKTRGFYAEARVVL